MFNFLRNCQARKLYIHLFIYTVFLEDLGPYVTFHGEFLLLLLLQNMPQKRRRESCDTSLPRKRRAVTDTHKPGEIPYLISYGTYVHHCFPYLYNLECALTVRLHVDVVSWGATFEGQTSRCQCFSGTYCLHHQPWRRTQYILLKHWYLPTSPHDIKTKETSNIVTALRT
jgi:hypothetical protein